MTDLPSPVVGVLGGHGEHHTVLKADYDTRHPDAPLPQLGDGRIDGRVSHDVIHELLAADCNALTGSGLPTELSPELTEQSGLVYLVGSPTLGHIDTHNVLHAAYNERHREGTVE